MLVGIMDSIVELGIGNSRRLLILDPVIRKWYAAGTVTVTCTTGSSFWLPSSTFVSDSMKIRLEDSMSCGENRILLDCCFE